MPSAKYLDQTGKSLLVSDYCIGPTPIKISVIDQGNGIPQESISKLFDRYYRVDQNSFTPGLDLGLYLSDEIIKSQGGKMGVDSLRGLGMSIIKTIVAWHQGKVWFKSKKIHTLSHLFS